MVARASHCKPDQLRRLLEGTLITIAAEEVTRHVERCDSCRRQMESLAAEESWWQDARRFLSDEVVLADDSPITGNTVPLGEIDTAPGELVIDFLGPSDNPAMLGRLGEYDVMEVIGRGGMGLVLKAYDRGLHRYLAIKVLAPHYASSAAARKRFAREAQAAAAVVHQHVVAIHGVDASGKLPYLVMPYVACESLQERLDRQGPLDVRDVLRIAMQAAEGLAAAHAQGLVHRDVKPANILLEKGVERVLLTDFGLARAIDDAALTRSGVIAGTPQYMSPEQAKGEAIDHRADLFSLGSVMYAMCTGRPPFRAETAMGVLRRICESEPRGLRELNPDVPGWLARIVDRLLSKRPNDRYANAAELADLLEKCLAHVQHPTAAPLPRPLRAVKPREQRWKRAILVGLAAVAAAAMPWLGVDNLDQSSKQRKPAAASAQSRPSPSPSQSQSETESTDATSQPSEALDWNDSLDLQLLEIERDLEWIDNTHQDF